MVVQAHSVDMARDAVPPLQLAALVALLLSALPTPAGGAAAAAAAAGHTSNWAVLVCTSKYWFNYRHMSNTLSFYRTVKRLGIPDSNIILMLADDVACNARNAYPGEVFNNEDHGLNVYGSNVEVDYRGYEVTVENFIRVLTGRHDPAVPRAKRMLSDKGSNILVYISGHGGNEFLKFQDHEELMAADIADAVQQMEQKGRYHELLLIVETCQAATLYSRIRSPGVLSMASSIKGESSYSYLTDMDIGLSLIDRFTYASLDFFEGVDIHSNMTMDQLMRIYRYELLESHFVYSAELFKRPLHRVKVTDFFGSVSVVKQTRSVYPLQGGVLADQAVTLRDTGPQPPGTAILALQHGVDALQTCTAERAREIIADEERQQPPPLQPVLSGPGDVVGQGPALAGTDWVTWCGIAGLAAAVGCTLLL